MMHSFYPSVLSARGASMTAKKLNSIVSILSIFLISIATSTAFAGERDFPAGYQAQESCVKQDYLWNNRLEPTQYRRLPAVTGSWTSLFSSIGSLIFLNQTFDHTSDALPGARQKIIHSHGSVAKVQIEIFPDSPFTGVYSPGKSCGIARLSLAGSESSLGYTPGMALKILLDGKPSINFHVMDSLNGQGRNRNFFAHTFTNRLPAPRGFTLNSIELALAATGRDLKHLPIAHGARIDRDGNRVFATVTPKQIAFVPLQSDAIPASSRNDFRIDLASISGTAPLYDVFGLDGTNNWVKIGRVSLMSKLIASEFGDRHLFFQHADR
jgi:hypothetical protein